MIRYKKSPIFTSHNWVVDSAINTTRTSENLVNNQMVGRRDKVVNKRNVVKEMKKEYSHELT